jgi:hypothetical protein
MLQKGVDWRTRVSITRSRVFGERTVSAYVDIRPYRGKFGKFGKFGKLKNCVNLRPASEGGLLPLPASALDAAMRSLTVVTRSAIERSARFCWVGVSDNDEGEAAAEPSVANTAAQKSGRSDGK